MYAIETMRLGLRPLTGEDFPLVAEFAQDAEVMYAWGHAFSDQETADLLNKHLNMQAKYGFSCYAAIDKEDNKFIGIIGLLIEIVEDTEEIGIGYILNKSAWGQGYALEGTAACVDHAFRNLNAAKVVAIIRTDNMSSRKVAEKLGMKIEGEQIRHHDGKDTNNFIYSCNSEMFYGRQ